MMCGCGDCGETIDKQYFLAIVLNLHQYLNNSGKKIHDA